MITDVQNEPEQLERLGAQRRLYSVAKQVQSWQILLSVPCVIAWSFLALKFPPLRPYAGLWGIVITLLDAIALDRWQKALKDKAARIQELFDCKVLELEWSDLFVGPRPDHELIAEHSARYRRTDSDFAMLRDWYSIAVGTLPLHLARLVCQRSSCWWDARLRRRYSISVLVALGAFSVLIVTLSLLEGASMENFILTGIAPLMPAITLAVRQHYEHRDAASRAETLKTHAEGLWRKALTGSLAAEELALRSRQFQDGLFEHRRRSPLIFDWIYACLRDTHEELMNKGAEALVNEAIEARGRFRSSGGS